MEKLMTVAQVLEYLQISKSKFYQMKAHGNGPPVVRIPNGRAVRYRKQDLEDWVARQVEEAAAD